MTYVIDSIRCSAWKLAFPDAVIVTEVETFPASLSPGDYVFSHVSDFRVFVGQDDFNPDNDLQRRIRAFRGLLIKSVRSGNGPTMVFYSGEPLKPTDENGIKQAVRKTSIPDSERIQVLRKAIVRETTVERLRLLGKAAYGEDPTDINARFDALLHRREYCRTFSLMAEAWLLVNWPPGSDSVDKILRARLRVGERKPDLPPNFWVPMTVEDWLEPFSADGSSIEDVVQKVRVEVGDVPARALSDFFASIRDMQPTFEKVSKLYTSLADAITNA